MAYGQALLASCFARWLATALLQLRLLPNLLWLQVAAQCVGRCAAAPIFFLLGIASHHCLVDTRLPLPLAAADELFRLHEELRATRAPLFDVSTALHITQSGVWLAGWLAGLVGWLAGWLASWPAGWPG